MTRFIIIIIYIYIYMGAVLVKISLYRSHLIKRTKIIKRVVKKN